MDEKNCCICCGETEHTVVYKFADLPEYKQIGEPRDIVKCQNCSTIYCYPRNLGESLLDIYENNYWQEYQTQVGEKEIIDRIVEFETISEERISNITRFKKEGKFLDIGCTRGFLVNAAKNRGFEAYGIDLNEVDIKNGKKDYNIDIEKCFIQDYERDNFDVICSFNVLEHVADPLKMLIEKKKRLKKGGMLVVGTHDVDCENHKREGMDWKHIIPNEHLYFFNLDTLNKLAKKAGLEMIDNHKPIENGLVVYYASV